MNKERIKMRFRLLYHTFFTCKNDELVDFVLKEFDFDETEIIKLSNYRYPKPTKKFNDDAFYAYHKCNIVGQVIKCNTLRRVKKLFGFIGQKVFIQNVLVSDGDRNMNGLEYAIWEKNIDIIQYLFSFDDIQKEYASNKELIWRCVWWMSGRRNYDESVTSYLMKTLNLNPEKLREL